jgi:hypothetical protein
MSIIRKVHSTNFNNNNNNNNHNVTKVFETPKRLKNQQFFEVKMKGSEYKKYIEYMKTIKNTNKNNNNIDIPSGQSEYAQKLANLDETHEYLISAFESLNKKHENLQKMYNDLFIECRKQGTITKYGKRTKRNLKQARMQVPLQAPMQAQMQAPMQELNPDQDINNGIKWLNEEPEYNFDNKFKNIKYKLINNNQAKAQAQDAIQPNNRNIRNNRNNRNNK